MINLPTKRVKNPDRGDLVYIDAKGNSRVIDHDKPWGVLQNLRKQLEKKQGFKNGKLKVCYPKVSA